MQIRSFRAGALLAAVLFAAPAWGDQVTLKNGDRLTGKLTVLDAKTLMLKTEYAGDVKISRAAVVSIVSDEPLLVTLKSGSVVEGRVAASPGGVEVRAATGAPSRAGFDELEAIRDMASQQAYEREQLRLTNPPLNDFWNGFVVFGLATARGNARTTTLNTTGSASRATGTDKVSLYFNQVYATQSTNPPFGATANRVGGGVRYDRNVSARAFAFVTTDFDYDKFLSLDLRSVLGGGLGYRLWKTPHGFFEFGAGGVWNREKFSTGLLRNSGELVTTEEAAYQLNSRLKLSQRMSFYPNLTDTGQYRLNFDSSAAAPIFKWLEWNVGFNSRYLSNPLPGKRKNDLLVTTGVRFSFDQTKR